MSAQPAKATTKRTVSLSAYLKTRGHAILRNKQYHNGR